MKKIPKGSTCDAYTGVDYSSRSPVIKRCKNPATKIVKTGKPGVFAELWLCDTCNYNPEQV